MHTRTTLAAVAGSVVIAAGGYGFYAVSNGGPESSSTITDPPTPGPKSKADSPSAEVKPKKTAKVERPSPQKPGPTDKRSPLKTQAPEKLSSFTVNYEPAAYRTQNVGRAAELINGSVVEPGETWSFNDTVGERTEANGFTKGSIIKDGRYVEEHGGGVSTMATTVYNAMFFSGVDLVEHGAHSFYIERYPEGREATVAWGSLDLRFRNNTGSPLEIRATSTSTSSTVSFWGERKYKAVTSKTGQRFNVTDPRTIRAKGEDCVPQPPYKGFDVRVQRILKSSAGTNRETYATHYTPRNEILCTKGSLK